MKYAKYIPARKDWKATDLANILIKDIFSAFGKPVLLMSNWEFLSTSNYWSHFCYHLSIQLNYSTAFHLQINGQTERQNQILEQYLHNYVNYQQNDWVFWLKLAEFTYNNSIYSSTGIALFIAMYGEEPTWTIEIRDERLKNVLSTKTRALNIARVREKLKARLKKAQKAQAKYYNKKHILCTFKARDKVYLNSKNIELICPSKKLDYKYYRSFKIEKPVRKQAYRLKLFEKIKIHNVFHVFLLEPYIKTNDSNVSAPPLIVVKEENEYKVEKILNNQIHQRKLQYLIKWLRYSHNKNQ